MSGIKHARPKGFTIVELLIVIVVIAILAAITVVAYNGSQQRARNAARLDTVTKALEVVEVALTRQAPSAIRATLNVTGPVGSQWFRACIGTGYKDVSGDSVGDCGWYGANSPYAWESAAFNTLIQTEVGPVNISGGFPKVTATDGDNLVGPYLSSAWVDSKDMLVVEYSLEGEGQKCDKSPLVYRTGSADTMTAPAGNAANYTKSAYGVTECVVAVVTNYY